MRVMGVAEASGIEEGREPVLRRAMPRKLRGRRISAEYELPFMAHAPMEPGNCTAHYQGTKCELWAPTQVPQDCRDSVATAIGLDPDQVKVNVTLMGGGFGRRLEHDYAVEAALVSKAINAPVKVIWTREDDMRFSTYRPASLHQLTASARWFRDFRSRSLTASSHPRSAVRKVSPTPNDVDPDLPDEAGPVYGIPNYSIEYVHDRNAGAAGLDAVGLRAASGVCAGEFHR